ncbi:tail protein [Actibacterium mucosum KCTC 23349]|uniref:Tail protein n=1 Tax=Actibacterium mucosum KCTC 23349 TaxID=1454373 RepID=A0A037ZKE7_9RHOB|nr:head-tail adaptor protein [Actibacterium mucosum]KAJ56578.1 tail protein [Actibacterium mucosum KCTC 23349]
MKTAPNLTRQLQLLDPQRVADGAGGFTETWVVLGTLWAEMKPGTGRETSGPVTSVSRVPYRITVHGAPVGAPSRPKAGQRFRDGTREFAVLAVTEADPLARFLTCFAEEEVSP